MARVTLLVGLQNGLEVDCPVNSREQADEVLGNLKSSDKLVRLPGICFVRRSGSTELGARGLVDVHPLHVSYTQILGADE
ncbi:MAG: hypothetical protein HUU60_02675 [Armatimonadetes bacterium]|nr:hypothetical protein [Armatimonadota bacterium]